jgi:2-keto-4-pentenoate hydratase
MTERIQEAAERLRRAGETGEPCAPIRDLIDPTDIAGAYAAQEINTAHWLGKGRRLVGRKIGLTAAAVQKQLGVDQPDFGMLFEDMAVDETRPIPFVSLLSPKVEAEISLVLKKPLTRSQHSIADIVDATDYAVASIEIVDSRIANWDIRLADTVADNASSSHFVLGALKKRLEDIDLVNCKMTMRRRGEEVSSGVGRACLGNPLNAAVWLADTMVKYGRPLEAGDVVMTGALGPMVAVVPGDLIEVEIEGLGSVRASFAEKP